MITESFLKDLEKFVLITKKRITSKYSGSRKSVLGGRGLTIKEYRPYTIGDDIRLIDWKVYAKTDDLFIKVYEEDKDLSVNVILDSTLSMSFGKSITKFDYSAMISSGFLFLALKENERFRYSFIHDDIELYSLKRGKKHFANFVSIVNKKKPFGKLNLYNALEKQKSFLKQKSMIVLLSDFLFSLEEIEKSLYLLKGNEVKIIRVLDEEELNPSFLGEYILKNKELDEEKKIFSDNNVILEYKKNLKVHGDNIRKICNNLNFEYYSFSTKKPIFDSLYELFSKKH